MHVLSAKRNVLVSSVFSFIKQAGTELNDHTDLVMLLFQFFLSHCGDGSAVHGVAL